jgi:hypothetical protein
MVSDAARLDAVLCFVDDADSESKELWESAEAGGFECYVEADSDESNSDVASEVFRMDDDDEPLLQVGYTRKMFECVRIISRRAVERECS